MAPTIQKNMTRDALSSTFTSVVRKILHLEDTASFDVDRSTFEAVIVHFQALGLINVQYAQAVGGGNYLFVSLTKKGEKTMIENLVFRKE